MFGFTRKYLKADSCLLSNKYDMAPLFGYLKKYVRKNKKNDKEDC